MTWDDEQGPPHRSAAAPPSYLALVPTRAQVSCMIMITGMMITNGTAQRAARLRDRPVTAEAMTTRTAATTTATIQRVQSMPGLPLPPKTV